MACVILIQTKQQKTTKIMKQNHLKRSIYISLALSMIFFSICTISSAEEQSVCTGKTLGCTENTGWTCSEDGYECKTSTVGSVPALDTECKDSQKIVVSAGRGCGARYEKMHQAHQNCHQKTDGSCGAGGAKTYCRSPAGQ